MQGSTALSSRLVSWGMDAGVSLPSLARTKPTAIMINIVPTWEDTINRYWTITYNSFFSLNENPLHSITKPGRKQADTTVLDKKRKRYCVGDQPKNDD